MHGFNQMHYSFDKGGFLYIIYDVTKSRSSEANRIVNSLQQDQIQHGVQIDYSSCFLIAARDIIKTDCIPA